ncbi:MAG: hypothetical protein CMI56_00100 [Parcubacteria group bacterium]|nr:hypothetical protein [Parcubacteria group bacterium]
MEQQTALGVALCIAIIYTCLRIHASGFLCIVFSIALATYVYYDTEIPYKSYMAPETTNTVPNEKVETSAKSVVVEEDEEITERKNIYGQSHNERKRLYERILMDFESYRKGPSF